VVATSHSSAKDSAYGRRLAIIVPYRDRSQHLATFVPHIVAYFERDKLDKQIRVSIHIVEQHGRAPFNRGALGNCGFALVRDSADYICIHDVDYLPIWTDYSWSAKPTRLIRYGLTLKEDWDNFFGAVVLFDNAAYERVNGFPNCYWGWGPEDLELGQRCRLTGLGFDARDGTYMALSHKHAGLAAPDVWTPEAQRTHAVYMTRRNDIASFIALDGVSTLKFKLLEKKPLVAGGQLARDSFHYIVDIGAPDTNGA
jgi:hypothetical protein